MQLSPSIVYNYIAQFYYSIMRTKSVISQTGGYASTTNYCNLELNSSISGSGLHTPRIIDRYDEDNQNLTTDFAAEWSRMDTTKRQTYSRLRNKFVKKFPSFRQKYKTQEITEQIDPEIRQTKRSQSENKSRLQHNSLQSTNKVHNPNIFKTGYFYSRSQKKCLYNSFIAGEVQEQQKETPIPRLSFINYIKNNKERQLLKFRKVKGHNMIKTRDKILNLQKQGTHSFLGLKKCLEESIEACIRGR